MVAQVYCCGQPTVAGFKAALEKVDLQLKTTKWLAANSPDSEWYQDCKKNYFELKALLVKRKAQRELLGDSCQMCHHCYRFKAIICFQKMWKQKHWEGLRASKSSMNSCMYSRPLIKLPLSGDTFYRLLPGVRDNLPKGWEDHLGEYFFNLFFFFEPTFFY